MKSWKIAAFYRFFPQERLPEQAGTIRAYGDSQGIRGSVLLAAEGINATVAGPENKLDPFLQFLRERRQIPLREIKFSWSNLEPFPKFKVKIKPEIVTFRQPGLDPGDPHAVGEYLAPTQWNELLRDPELTLIDTRNDYEYRVGHFPGALNPHTDDFTAFADWVDHNLDPHRHSVVGMYCTGGIRCEKATAYLKKRGFAQVYHLQGGILKYLEDVPAKENQWRGDCFVFDYRVALNRDLEPCGWAVCPRCHEPYNRACPCGYQI